MGDSWSRSPLGELLKEKPRNGYSPQEASSPTGRWMLGLGCLSRDGFRPIQLKYAPANDPGIERAILQDGDILISRSNTRDAVGFVGVFKNLGQPCIYPDLMMRLRPSKQVEPRFLVRQLQSSTGRRQIEALASGTSGSMVKLNRESVERIEIAFPPLPEQRQIAEILDTLDEAIRKTEAILAKLRQVKQGLLHDLLTRGIDDNGELRDPERHPEDFKDSPLGRIPKGWGVAAIEALLANVTSAMRSGPFGSALLKAELVERGVPLLGIDNVHVEEFVPVFSRFVTPSKAAQLSRYQVYPRDLMITIMGTVGRCCVVPDNLERALSSKHVWTLTLDQERYSPFLACLQMNYAPWVLRHFKRDEQGGIMSAIRSDTLRTTLLPVPPRVEQSSIEERLRTLSTRVVGERETADKLRLLKQALLDDLLTGRVRVTHLLKDDPS